MRDPNWFHVYDSTNTLWLRQDGRWGSYFEAQEFPSYEAAKTAGKQALKKLKDKNTVVAVLADHGNIADE